NGPTASHFSVHQQRPVIFPRASPTRARAQTPGKRNQLDGATSAPAHLANREIGDVISGSQQVTFQLGPFSNPICVVISYLDYWLERFSFLCQPLSPLASNLGWSAMLQWQWKLTSIYLPEQLRTQLAAKLAKQMP